MATAIEKEGERGGGAGGRKKEPDTLVERFVVVAPP